MSKKENKFEPTQGWLVAVNYQQVALNRVAVAMGADPVKLGQALDTAGYLLEPDPFGYMSDTWKIAQIEKRKSEESVSE